MGPGDDVVPEIEGGLPTYPMPTRGEVLAARIERDGRTAAYLVTGADPEQGTVGLVRAMDQDIRPLSFWFDELDASFRAGRSARDAAVALLGRVGPAGAGSVDTVFQPAESRAALERELNPQFEEFRARRRPVVPTREEIDAVLRGEAENTPAIEQAIAGLDHAVRVRPADRDYAGVVWTSRDRLPAELVPGTLIDESAYLTMDLVDDDVVTDADVVLLVLTAPPGTPAMFIEPDVPGLPGRLLLARGLTWEVTEVALDGVPATVRGRIVPLGAQAG
jgi:hypothetical protein